MTRPEIDICIDCMTVESSVSKMPSTAFLDSSHTANLCHETATAQKGIKSKEGLSEVRGGEESGQ